MEILITTAKQGTQFISHWHNNKQDYEKVDLIEEEAEAFIPRLNTNKNMKGKESFANRITNANLSEWKDHKWIVASFFLNYKKSFLFPEEISQTFQELENSPEENSRDIINFTEDYLEYKKLDTNTKKKLKKYGRKLQDKYLARGLSNKEVTKRQEVYGPNKLFEKKQFHWSFSFLSEITSLFSMMLWMVGNLAVMAFGINPEDTSNLYIAIVLWIVVIFSGLFTFCLNLKSDNILKSFKSFSNTKVEVIRNGEKFTIPSIELVVGDVVTINTGDKIPADIRVFHATALTVDNSGLTGESETIKIDGTCGEKGLETPLEARNICFFSTNCKSGTGKGVVIRIGENTCIGKITNLTKSVQIDRHNLIEEIDYFIIIISLIAVALCVAFFLGLIGYNFPINTSFTFVIAGIVANAPEGLLGCLTTTLALTANTLFKRNVFIKNMQSLETLGGITCICSDKTGTLTQNKMTVVHVWYDCEFKKINESQEDIQIDNNLINLKLINQNDYTFKYFQFSGVCGCFSNFIKQTPDDFHYVVHERNLWISKNPEASSIQISEQVSKLKKKYQSYYDVFYKNNILERHTDGDASETGIIKFFEKIEPIDDVRLKYPQHIVNGEDIKIPFDSAIKTAGSLRKIAEENEYTDSFYWLAYKGAPEILIKQCTTYMIQGKEYEMDDFFKKRFADANKAFALKGERVFGLAYYKLNKKDFPFDFEFKNDIGVENGEANRRKIPNFSINNLCFIGLIGLEDPPRIGVKEAIATCKKAGIKIIMITGDQTLTAASIAYQIGIIENLEDTPEIIKIKENLPTIEAAEKKSNTLIIDGGRLTKMLKADQNLSEDNPNKGAFFRDWIMKRDVVFARTSPDQKLIIVDACQKLSHIVAVTGDGANDLPAIKKANIGIAMGKVGADVAKDAADILLMDDNFANVVEGIRQGRIVFDNLKKIIAYDLCSNISELVPVVSYFIFAFPIPLTTILILTIDVGSNIYPNIAFSYEDAESSIMDRPPKNSKTDKLCTLKLFAWSYLFMGIVEMISGMLAYFVVMNDYGFKSEGIINIIIRYGVEPLKNDLYNPYDQYKGNSNAFLYENADKLEFSDDAFEEIKALYRQVDYDSNVDQEHDLRVFLYDMNDEAFGECAYHGLGYKKISQVCYSLEAVRHAQSAYLVNTVLIQVSNNLCFRTIYASLFTHILNNHHLNVAYFIEIFIMLILVYIPGLNYGFALRPLIIEHWTPCLGPFIILFIYSEFTKYLIRNYNKADGSPGLFSRLFRY